MGVGQHSPVVWVGLDSGLQGNVEMWMRDAVCVCACDTCKVNNEFLLALFPMYGKAVSKLFLIPRPRPVFHCSQYGSTAYYRQLNARQGNEASFRSSCGCRWNVHS